MRAIKQPDLMAAIDKRPREMRRVLPEASEWREQCSASQSNLVGSNDVFLDH